MCVATKYDGNADTNGTISKGYSSYPTSSSALQRTTPLILYGYAFNTICHFLVYAALPATLSPAPEYCPPDEPNCNRHGLFAFQVVSFVNLSALGLLGFHTFFVSKRASNALPRTPQGRYFGNVLNKGRVLLPEADYINAVIVIFQGWDFLASLFFEEHCTTIMMTHHVLAFVCGFFCLVYEVNPYYAVYFGGVSEFSSIFLCISQLFMYFPPSTLAPHASSLSTVLPALEAFSQAMFVITFVVFRIFGWAYASCMLLSDGAYVLKNGLLRRYGPGSGWFLWFLMSMTVLLGGLQVYWVTGIMEKVLEILNGN